MARDSLSFVASGCSPAPVYGGRLFRQVIAGLTYLTVCLWALPLLGAGTTFAVIGDYGTGNRETEGRVAEMIRLPAWNTDFILTAGDNNYGQIDQGANGEWEQNIGNYYGQYILGRTDNAYPLQTSATQRFFPSLGNHDSTASGTGQTGETGGLNPGFVDYFHTDPGNPAGRLPAGVFENDRLYYDFEQGDVHFYVLDSDHAREDPSLLAEQQAWLQDSLAGSTARWNFVAFHHAPYSSSSVHGNHGYMQLPFGEWGVDAVLAAHDHTYERSVRFDVPYFVSGLGGNAIYDFGAPGFFSEARYNESHGALRVNVDGDQATFEFYSIDDGAGGANGGRLIDSYTIDKVASSPARTQLIAPNSIWSFLDDGSDQGTDWRAVDFPAATAWPSGSAELGYGDGDEATVISCGPTAPDCGADHHPTTYFRKMFQVEPQDLLGVSRLVLEVVRDDGVAVYLNGTEVARDLLDASATFADFANGSVSGSKREPEWIPFAVAPALLLPGANVLAAEVHQDSATSSDVSFNLQLTTDFGSLPRPQVTLLPAGSNWSYLDDGTDLGTVWRAADYLPAAAWASGPAQLGYGDDDEATTVKFVDTDPQTEGDQRNATTYFRTTFDVDDPTAYDALTIELLRDDGAAVYLNGSLVALSNLDADATFDTFANSSVTGDAEEAFLHFAADASLLVVGENVLAVEVHQRRAASSDVGFDLRVLATLAVPEPAGLVWLGLFVCGLALHLHQRRR